MVTSKLVNRNPTKLIRIDAGWHKLLKLKATAAGVSIREYLEGILSDTIQIEGIENER